MLLSVDFLRSALPSARIMVLHNGCLQPYNGQQLYNHNRYVSVAFDSTLLREHDFFVALSGAKVDGHTFIADVLAKGASGLLVHHDNWLTGVQGTAYDGRLVVCVDDTLQALQQLAAAWRNQCTIPIVAITGSVGKTSSKEMLRTVLHTCGINALVSEKNQNTIIGVCVSLLGLHPDHQVGVFEVGISYAGEMATRAALVRPTIGVITMVAESHAEGLGGFAGIVREKVSLFDAVVPDGTVIINGDQDVLSNREYNHRVVTFGTHVHATIQARSIHMMYFEGAIQTSFVLVYGAHEYPIVLSGVHKGFVTNALAVAAIAHELGLPGAGVAQGLKAYQSFTARFEQKKLKNNAGIIISDCYNASPESMMRALEALRIMQHDGTKIAVIGDMLELGDRDAYWHYEVGQALSADPQLTHIVLIGKKSSLTRTTLQTQAQIMVFDTVEAALLPIQQLMVQSPVVLLVKGARSIKLDVLVHHLSK